MISGKCVQWPFLVSGSPGPAGVVSGAADAMEQPRDAPSPVPGLPVPFGRLGREERRSRLLSPCVECCFFLQLRPVVH